MKKFLPFNLPTVLMVNYSVRNEYKKYKAKRRFNNCRTAFLFWRIYAYLQFFFTIQIVYYLCSFIYLTFSRISFLSSSIFLITMSTFFSSFLLFSFFLALVFL